MSSKGDSSKKSRACVGVYRGHEGTVYTLDIQGPQTLTNRAHSRAHKTGAKKNRVAPDPQGSMDTDDLNAAPGIVLVSGSHDHTVISWTVRTGAPHGGNLSTQLITNETYTGHTAAVYALELLPGGAQALSAGDNSLRLWDLQTGECIRTFTGHDNHVSSLRIRGKRAFSGSWDTTIRSWNVETGKPMHIFRGHRNIVNAVDVTDTDVFSGSWDTTVIQWSRSTGEALNVYRGHTDGVQCVQVVGENMLVSGSMDKTVRVWSQKTAKPLRILTGHTGGIECLHATGGVVFSGSYDKSVRCFDIHTGHCLAVFEGHTDGVYSVRYFDGVLYSGSGDKTIRTWDARGLVRTGAVPWYRRVLGCCA
ncbi:WD40-repeat-containing domain protein [Fimicolochytrium jonesii]|uniref:WD40-repeat-containing domain protein n=1 Tax=Fimicolochytrium jonesii TaxID=1396493 RepID=UPI0022FEFBEE|nr:WD40-repeat-containing domain protein [Fimicolochytrium jonesii]KAI8821310.1 WD40-repeat-containing domain protein [Fimicolochytrium jonesii]